MKEELEAAAVRRGASVGFQAEVAIKSLMSIGDALLYWSKLKGIEGASTWNVSVNIPLL